MNAEPFILLNGKQVNAEQLAKQLKNPNLQDWEKELYLFLKEWFSDTDYILAQTSGSTGEPKPIRLPKSIMRKSAGRTIEYFDLQPADRLLLSLPCRYIAGKMMAVRAIVGQMNLITVDPVTDFSFLDDERFDLGALVPIQVSKILELPRGPEKLQQIRNLLVGGSAISAELTTQVSRLNSRIVSTYGMTETASHIAIRELSGKLKSEFYHCLSGISVSLQGNACLQIHLPEFQEPLQTNDLAKLQSEKAFKILGRADSVIISGGIKYSPETIEKKLEPLIQQSFAISSVADKKLGERMVLVLEGNTQNTEHLERKMAALLSAFERPKSIFFLEKLPLTASGKIRRDEIKQLIKNAARSF